MKSINNTFLLLIGLFYSTYLTAQNPWDGLMNSELAGNVFNSDKTGYSFNYGNMYPASEYNPAHINCTTIKGDIDYFSNALSAEFISTESNDLTTTGKGSIKYSFAGGKKVQKLTNLFMEGNCSNAYPIKVTKDSKLKAMVKTSIDCYLLLNAIDLQLPKEEQKAVLLKKNQWTEVEFNIGYILNGKEVTVSEIAGITYEFRNDIQAYYTTLPAFDFYVDWAEAGNNVGLNPNRSIHKTEYFAIHKLQAEKAQNFKQDSTGYTFNFGTDTYQDSINYLYNNCIDGYVPGYPYDNNSSHDVYNFMKEQGVTTSISPTEFIDSTKHQQGSLKYSFDGTQKQEGYVITKFYEDRCYLINNYNRKLTIENKNHQKIRAMVKTSKDAYLRMFVGISQKNGYSYNTVKYSKNDSTDVFNRPIYLKANEWTEVEFNFQELIDNYPFPVSFNEILGVTTSITNHIDEKQATPFPVDLYIDWLEIGSTVGTKKTKTNNVLANNLITDVSFEYNFSTSDSSKYKINDINCVPLDSISNDIFNINNTQNIKIHINKDNQKNDKLDGSLQMTFEQTTNDWIINKFMKGNCESTLIDLSNSAQFTLTIKATENISLKVTTVIAEGNYYYVNDTLNSVQEINLQKGNWQTITVNIPTFFGQKIVDLSKVLGIAFKVSPSNQNNRVSSNNPVILLIDQITTDKKLTSIEKITTQNFSVYPNPSTYEITVNNLPSNSSVTIYNTLGEIVKTSDEATLNIADLTNGIYFLQIIKNDQVIYSQKIIKN